MKKGKRQIVDKNIFNSQENGQNQQQQACQSGQEVQRTQEAAKDTTILGHQLKRQIAEDKPQHLIDSKQTPKMVTQTKKITTDEISISPNSQIRNQTEGIKTIIQPVAENVKGQNQLDKNIENQKKSRIEMLKQKYLKKNNQSIVPAKETSKAAVLVEQTNLATQTPLEKYRPLPKKNEVEQKTVTLVNQQVQIDQLSKKTQVPIPEKKTQIQQNRLQLQVQQKCLQQKESKKIPDTNEDEKINKAKHFIIPPPPGKTMPKIKPPPPSLKNNPQNTIVQVQNYQKQIRSQVIPTQASCLQVNESKFERVIPPAPFNHNNHKSAAVQQILTKKMKKQPNIQKQQQWSVNQPQEVIKMQDKRPITVSNTPIISFDQQYIEKGQQTNTLIDNPKIDDINISDMVSGWISDHISTITAFNPLLSNVLKDLEENISSTQFNFTSKNPNFTPIINKFIVEFVLKSSSQLSTPQKQVIYQFAMQYFYSNPKELTSQFLLLLIKLGNNYFSRYAQFFKYNVERYYITILQNRTCFVGQQLTNFINFLIELRELKQEEIGYLLLISPSQKLISSVSNRPINKVGLIIYLLSIIKILKKKNQNLTGLYFRWINVLIDNIEQEYQLIEIIMKHVNELEVIQKFYQAHKQLKIKIINIITNKGQIKSSSKRQQTADKDTKNEGSGLMGYWSKAVDKIKTVTTQFAENSKVDQQRSKNYQSTPSRQTQVIKQAQDQIVYDPVSKRYLINGKIPDDQDHRPSQSNAPKLPPPKMTKGLAPPPPPGKKPRAINNRYV